MHLGFTASAYRVGWTMGGRKVQVHVAKSEAVGDRLVRYYETALEGVRWIRRNMAIAGFPEKKFRLNLVTGEAAIVRTIDSGSSNSAIISRIVKELLPELETFGEWTIEHKTKEKP